MYDDYIELLIDSIETYNNKYHPPYFILLYLPRSEEFDKPEELYFAALAAMLKPNEDMIAEIFFETRKQIGNIVYAADYKVLKKDQAIEHLESLLN